MSIFICGICGSDWCYKPETTITNEDENFKEFICKACRKNLKIYDTKPGTLIGKIYQLNLDKEKIIIRSLFQIKSENKRKFKEMCLELDLAWTNYIKSWYQLIHDPNFLQELFKNHVRLSKDKIGIPYWFWIRDYLSKCDGEETIGFIYLEWKTPSFTTHYSDLDSYYYPLRKLER